MTAPVLWLIFALASLAGYFFRLWRRERWLRLARNTWGAASHDRWAGDNAIWSFRVEQLRAKLTADAIFDAMWFASGDMKGPGGGPLGYPGPQPPREFAGHVARILAAANWEQRRAALQAARSEALPE